MRGTARNEAHCRRSKFSACHGASYGCGSHTMARTGVDDAVARAVMKIQQESPTPSAVRLRNLKLADLAVDELYLYSPIHKEKATKKPRKTGKR